MTGNEQFSSSYSASSHAASASRYFAMAWAANSVMWQEQAMAELRHAAEAMGFQLVPIASTEPAISAPRLEAAE